MNIEEKDFPGLYQCADKASMKEQKLYFRSIATYLILLILAAFFAYVEDGNENSYFKILSAILFLATLSITIGLRVAKPDDIWYNGRAVAESVKTRSWRWMMRAEPYNSSNEIDSRTFVSNLQTILQQNQSLIGKIGTQASVEDPISDLMIQVRNLNLQQRIAIYREKRITDQALWYTKKAKLNKSYSTGWFIATIILHAAAIICLLYNIKEPLLKLPIEVIATAASSILTWSQAKKHNELFSSYSLTAHEIILMKGSTVDLDTEDQFSEYVINCENAFSREHTQWFARKKDN
ncbi:MAG: DUF4231 domain-containing protein [Flavobacterium sp.]